MSSKDKENKSIQEKLKQFFRLGKGGTGNIKTRIDFAITPELERELGKETPINQRLKAIKELCGNVSTIQLEDEQAVEKLWLCTCDLLELEQSKECRHTVLLFLRSLIQSQYDLLKLVRVQFFRVVKEHQHHEDTQQRLDLLQTLTDNGKDIKYFEDQIGKFMLQWMPTINSPDLIKDFLSVLVNLIKFNAAYLDEDVISGFVNKTCFLCCYSAAPQVVLGCLQVLETVVCYSIFPHESLQTFISALCRTVNVEQYCQTSWKIMRSVLGTDLGHSALHLMCVALNSGDSDCALVRGAVFYLNMALWGSKRVTTLKCTPTQVLPSFLKALEGNQSVVTYEVILAMQSLVNKHGKELHEPAWDLIFSILLTIINQIESSQSPYQLTVSHLHETITCIEKLHDSGHFNGNVDNMYNVINMCGHTRPEASVIKLINYMTFRVIPTNHDWLLTLNTLVERYCRQEARVSIRLKVLQILQTIMEQNRSCYEEELLDRVILPNLQQCSMEADPTIRCASAKLLIELALHCHSKRFSDIFDILEKLLNRPFELYVTTEPISLSADTDISDISAVASGMVKVFLDKLHRLPSSYAVRAYFAALRHLEMHYEKPSLFENHPSVRFTLLEWLLSARANSYYHVGFPSAAGGRVYYSPYLCVEGMEGARPSHSPTPQPHNIQSQIAYVSIRKACNTIVTCLKHEKDWSVLQMVLREIPKIMQNKALVLSKNSNDIHHLATALCSMVVDNSLPSSLRVTGKMFSRSEFHYSVLPVLTCLAPYHAHLDPQPQQRIINRLIKFGLVSRCAQQCVTALTIFTLEMRDTMVKLLPEVLLDLSKISATVYIAVPILEFLSTLTRLPTVFASFVGDQYMSVFAILLPYTNPFKYNHYIVSLAHHVTAAWFLKCRLPFRRDSVKFIKQCLHSNILKPIEEGKLHQDFMEVNQDSSSRKRSSSLTEQGSRRRELPKQLPLGEPTLHEASVTFHIELTETCIDLLARYTYSPSILAPKRLHTADFLLSGGQTMMWLVGQKIISITTSGCAQNALRQGLCDRCLVLCKAHTDSVQSPYGTGGTGTSGTLTAGSESDRGSSEGLLKTVDGDIKSQNSSENKNEVHTGSPKGSTEPPQPAQLSLKLESLANKQSSEEKGYLSALPPRLEHIMGGSGSGASESRLQCGCWCGGWAEVHVRGPTGDVSWVMRIQNQVNFDSLWSEFPLSDISSLFLGGNSGPSPSPCAPAPPQHLGSAASIASSGFQDAKSDMLSDGDPRSRSGSGGSQPEQIQKSSSDSVVGLTAPPAPPHASTHCIVPAIRSHVISTGPINIPGSPQRQNSSGTNTDDEEGQMNPNDPSSQAFLDEQNKSRHPVRRSNSSPEMSSSWKNPFHVRERMEAMEAEDKLETLAGECSDAVSRLNNGNEQTQDNVTYAKSIEEGNSSGLQLSKKGHTMKSLTKDMRVSCEAIPEEMSGSTPPHPLHHPHLSTYNSDPGSTISEKSDSLQVSSTSTSEINVAKVSFELEHSKAESDVFSKVNKPADIVIVNSTKATNFTGDTITKVQMSQDVMKLSAKPPHSPAPASPRPTSRVPNLPAPSRQPLMSQGRSNSLLPTDNLRNAANFSLKFNEMQSSQQGNMQLDDLPPVSRSKRSNTISVMSPTRRRRDNPSPKPKDSCSRWGASPAFVFLQLYHGSGAGGAEHPLLLSTPLHMRSVSNLDLVPPLETYRIGVLYIGRGQHDNETSILKNEFGSLRYAEFLQDLGTLISLEDPKSLGLFLDVEKGGRDGRFAYVWKDDIMQVLFHVATLMPNNPSDPECNEKRKHIGNDFVSIVYNESGEDFNIQTIKGHFNFACIIIEPLDHGTNKVTIKTKGELIEKEFLNTTEPKIISDQNVALLARQLALHANLASLVSQSLRTNSTVPTPYASNWLERLRIIKRLRNKLLEERNEKLKSSSSHHVSFPNSGDGRNRLYMEDFTEYT